MEKPTAQRISYLAELASNENFWWPEIATTRQGNYHLSDALGDLTDEWPGVYGKYPGDNQSNLYGINYFGIWDGACGH